MINMCARVHYLFFVKFTIINLLISIAYIKCFTYLCHVIE
nr:MAG TPA: hypothetical protein [Microviridae sp.]